LDAFSLNIPATTFSSLPLPRPKSCGGSPARSVGQRRATEPGGSDDGAAGPCGPAHRGHPAPRGPPPRGPFHRRWHTPIQRAPARRQDGARGKSKRRPPCASTSRTSAPPPRASCPGATDAPRRRWTPPQLERSWRRIWTSAQHVASPSRPTSCPPGKHAAPLPRLLDRCLMIYQ
jgi:hypothetical protein